MSADFILGLLLICVLIFATFIFLSETNSPDLNQALDKLNLSEKPKNSDALLVHVQSLYTKFKINENADDWTSKDCKAQIDQNAEIVRKYCNFNDISPFI